ncbi:MAG: zinc ribbon domain-containing protein [Chloroflexota bacterium]
MMNCPCGNRMDRDLNAAINIKNYAVSTTACVPMHGAAIALTW